MYSFNLTRRQHYSTVNAISGKFALSTSNPNRSLIAKYSRCKGGRNLRTKNIMKSIKDPMTETNRLPDSNLDLSLPYYRRVHTPMFALSVDTTNQHQCNAWSNIHVICESTLIYMYNNVHIVALNRQTPSWTDVYHV